MATIEDRRSITNGLVGNLSGHYYAMKGTAAFASQFDSLLKDKNIYYEINVMLSLRAENGVSGVAAAMDQIGQSKDAPFSSAIAAVSKLVASKEGDKGAADTVTLVNFNSYLPDLLLLPWNTRQRYWKKSDRVRSALMRLSALRVGGQFPAPSVPLIENGLSKTQQSLRELAWMRMCSQRQLADGTLTPLSVPNSPMLVYICNLKNGSELDVADDEVIKSVEECLAASSDEVTCTDKRLFAAIVTVAHDEYLVRDGLTPSEALNLFLDDVSRMWSEYTKPLAFRITEHNDETPRDLRIVYDADGPELWLRFNKESSVSSLEIASTAVIYNSHFDADYPVSNYSSGVVWFLSDKKAGQSLRDVSHMVRKVFDSYATQTVDVFVDIETIDGRQKVFVGTFHRQ